MTRKAVTPVAQKERSAGQMHVSFQSAKAESHAARGTAVYAAKKQTSAGDMTHCFECGTGHEDDLIISPHAVEWMKRDIRCMKSQRAHSSSRREAIFI